MIDHANNEMTSSVIIVAQMMELAARTAPKTKGEDFIKIQIVTGDKLKELAEAMLKFGSERKKENFDRDGANVAASDALVLIGLKNASTVGLNCGACGFESCNELERARRIDIEFKGPICSYRFIDLGIAVGSAVKTAQIFNVDNRVMYRPGVVARWTGIVDWDYVLGIPLSATGKSPFFDRKQ
jgi:uncharacterized ferredoxin-like protein